MADNKYTEQVVREPWVKSINPEVVESIIHFDGEKDAEVLVFEITYD